MGMPPRPFRDWVTSDGRALLGDLKAALEAIAADVVRATLRPREVGTVGTGTETDRRGDNASGQPNAFIAAVFGSP